MKYYLHENRSVHSIENGSQSIMPGYPDAYTEITREEAEAIITPPPTIEQAREKKAAEIKESAGSAILAGVSCDALGSEHIYPCARDDQMNINGLVTESLLSDSGNEYKFWCADTNGAWARRVHTKAQIQSVGKAVANHVKSQQERYEQRLIAIANANIETIGSVIW